MTKLEGKVAVVTGSSRGIGAAIAVRFGADGAKVVVNYNQNTDAAEQVVARIKAAGGDAFAAQADMADLAQGKRLFDSAVRTYGRLDILVNNAALAEYQPLEAITEEHYSRLFDLNVRGLLFATQEAAKRFDSAGGRIIHITSGAARACPPNAAVYSATKAAVEAMMRCHAYELGPRRITVNAVAPGPTDTEMLRAVLPADVQKALIETTALRRLGQPEDIADVVAFLASDDARWVTAQVIDANGGLR